MKKLAAAIPFILFLAACETETPPQPISTPSKEDIISKTWTITEAKENGTATPDFTGNKITFNKNNTYTAVSPFETVNGTWQFNSDKSHVIFDANAKPDELLSDWAILELNNEKFKWKWVRNQESVEATMEP
jgi:hypothetical protein